MGIRGICPRHLWRALTISGDEAADGNESRMGTGQVLELQRFVHNPHEPRKQCMPLQLKGLHVHGSIQEIQQFLTFTDAIALTTFVDKF